MVVEGLCEIIAVVHQEPASIQSHCLTNHKVFGCEVLFDLVIGQLHDYSGERRGDVVAILWHSVAADEDGEGVTAVIGLVAFSDLQGVINKVVLKDTDRICIGVTLAHLLHTCLETEEMCN